MKKLLMALALSAMCISPAYAAEEKTENTEIKEEKTMTDSYIVEKTYDEGALVYKKSNENDKYNIKKEDLKGLDLKKGDELVIDSSTDVLNSYPAQFTKVNSIKKVDKKESNETSKEESKEKKLEDNFIVESIVDEAITVARKSNKEDKFIIGTDKLNGIKVSVGDELRIVSDDIILPSNPGQFGKIYEISKVSEDKNKPAKKDDKKEASKSEKSSVKKDSGANPKTGIGSSLGLIITGIGSAIEIGRAHV